MRRPPGGPLGELDLEAVELDDAFWTPRVERNRTVTLEHQYTELERSGCLDNFRRVAAGAEDGFEGMWFADSDAYKWLEAGSYALTSEHDEELAHKVNRVIDLVGAAQADDGYLNTYVALAGVERWANLNTLHELYCAGHLLEAAVAHFRATDSNDLLSIATALADHLDEVFGPEAMDGHPGHEGIELALVNLWRVTGTDRYLDLARFFVDRRGQPDSRLRWEFERLEDLPGSAERDEAARRLYLDEDGTYDGSYAQDHEPIRDQETIEGHAVRATYFLTGATDLLLADAGDEALEDAVERLWRNMSCRRTYVTGGIGSSHDHEGFTEDFDLPNETAYAETCAAVGSIRWNHRLQRLTGEARFGDLLERTLYNGFLAGVSLDGEEFFYDNPLASDGDHHREEWFETACCPPNVARTLASLERYVYLGDDDRLYVSLFVDSRAEHTVDGTTVEIEQRTEYPWDGTIDIILEPTEPVAFELGLRVPGWCDEATLLVEGEPRDVNSGYATVERTWDAGAVVELDLSMPVERVRAHPSVEANVGKVALRRGPLIYCLEAVDHDRDVRHLRLSDDTAVEATFEPDLLDGVTTLSGEAVVPDAGAWEGRLYRSNDKERTRTSFTAVPYYAWDEREPGAMRVWIGEE